MLPPPDQPSLKTHAGAGLFKAPDHIKITLVKGYSAIIALSTALLLTLRRLFFSFQRFFLGAALVIQLTVIAVVMSGVFGSVALIQGWLHRGAATYRSAVLLEYKPADKLFTTFVYLPYIKKKMGHLKREFFVSEQVKRNVVKGYCKLDYRLGVGYDNVQNILVRFQNEACRSDLMNRLPDPVILSANAEHSSLFGDVDMAMCDAVDADSDARSHELAGYMKAFSQWEPVARQSKAVLAGFIRLYCANP